MEYTTNYHLPQWVETDRILMEDFNQAMANIDKNAGEIKLAERTVTEAVNEVDFDFSGIDLSRFSEIHFRLNGEVRNTAGVHYLYFNDQRTENLFKNSGTAEPGYRVMNLGGSSIPMLSFGAVITLTALPGGMALHTESRMIRVQQNIESYEYSDGTGTNKLVLTDVHKVTFSFPSAFQPGYRFVITGVPK